MTNLVSHERLICSASYIVNNKNDARLNHIVKLFTLVCWHNWMKGDDESIYRNHYYSHQSFNQILEFNYLATINY